MRPKQKRVKWVTVGDESERVSERKKWGWFTCLKSEDTHMHARMHVGARTLACAQKHPPTHPHTTGYMFTAA